MIGIIAIYLFILGLAGIFNVAAFSSQRRTSEATLAAIFVVVDAFFGFFLLTHH